ncbi:MAG TPA: hypothetical protein VEH04_18085 [Verrucomicrobiae bacterium]|nr:hypothetical protein [Verrucomicrobiae bacterium]
MREHRIYVYKCAVDNGGARCVDDGLLPLAIATLRDALLPKLLSGELRARETKEGYVRS